MTGHLDIPDITGKADGLGPEGGDVAQDVVGILVDRVFRHGDGDALMGTGRFQAAQGQGRLDELGIQNSKQRFHGRPSFRLYMYIKYTARTAFCHVFSAGPPSSGFSPAPFYDKMK